MGKKHKKNRILKSFLMCSIVILLVLYSFMIGFDMSEAIDRKMSLYKSSIPQVRMVPNGAVDGNKSNSLLFDTFLGNYEDWNEI